MGVNVYKLAKFRCFFVKIELYLFLMIKLPYNNSRFDYPIMKCVCGLRIIL